LKYLEACLLYSPVNESPKKCRTTLAATTPSKLATSKTKALLAQVKSTAYKTPVDALSHQAILDAAGYVSVLNLLVATCQLIGNVSRSNEEDIF
jgi:hypothetical protein